MILATTRIITLYLLMVLVSACVIALHLKVSILAAAGTAAFGCVAKTIVAYLHGIAFDRMKPRTTT